MKYVTQRDAVEVTLEQDDDEVALRVGGWYVGCIGSDGCLHLHDSIEADNPEGLQVDKDGRIKIVKDR